MVLTAFNDNAAITYLASLVPGLTEDLKYAVVAGAMAAGGLTVIANAPNPAGQAVLARHFPAGVSPLYLAAVRPSPRSSLRPRSSFCPDRDYDEPGRRCAMVRKGMKECAETYEGAFTRGDPDARSKSLEMQNVAAVKTMVEAIARDDYDALSPASSPNG